MRGGKIIENTQRDVNIALMNGLSIICSRLGINAFDVLDAAGTKWNFLKFLLSTTLRSSTPDVL